MSTASTKYVKYAPFLKRVRFEEDIEDLPIAVSVDNEYDDGEGYNLDEYEIRWYCYQCDMMLTLFDESILSMKNNNFDVVEDDNGDPRIVERIVVESPTPKNKTDDDLTTVDDVGNAADIDINANPNSNSNEPIAYCNHCHANIMLEEKPKLRHLIIRKDTDEVVDVNQLFYGYDNTSGDVLISELPDALAAYYEGRKPKLSGAFAQMFGPGSTMTLLNYVESDPIHGITYEWSSDGGNYDYSGRDTTTSHISTEYGRIQSGLKPKGNVRIEENTNGRDATNDGVAQPQKAPRPYTYEGSSIESPLKYYNRMMKEWRQRGRIRW